MPGECHSGRLAALAVSVFCLTTCVGCARESLRVAIAAQQRADQVQQAVFERQHDALRVLLFRDLEARLAIAGQPLTADQHTLLNEAWNERDLVEFWMQQHERARALRLVGVDAKLYADQPAVDLLYKALSTKMSRAQDARDALRDDDGIRLPAEP